MIVSDNQLYIEKSAKDLYVYLSETKNMVKNKNAVEDSIIFYNKERDSNGKIIKKEETIFYRNVKKVSL